HCGYLLIEAICKEKSEKILYLTLTQHLNAMANFKTAARETLSACSELFDSKTCNQVNIALGQVGL
ncbi:MAG: M4 family metallopeptidase, partial [Bdellovibrionota bacterium]